MGSSPTGAIGVRYRILDYAIARGRMATRPVRSTVSCPNPATERWAPHQSTTTRYGRVSKVTRDGEVVSRQAHNLEITGSIPVPAIPCITNEGVPVANVAVDVKADVVFAFPVVLGVVYSIGA